MEKPGTESAIRMRKATGTFCSRKKKRRINSGSFALVDQQVLVGRILQKRPIAAIWKRCCKMFILQKRLKLSTAVHTVLLVTESDKCSRPLYRLNLMPLSSGAVTMNS